MPTHSLPQSREANNFSLFSDTNSAFKGSHNEKFPDEYRAYQHQSCFIDTFVTKHQEHVPELWNFYGNYANHLGSDIKFNGRIFA